MEETQQELTLEQKAREELKEEATSYRKEKLKRILRDMNRLSLKKQELDAEQKNLESEKETLLSKSDEELLYEKEKSSNTLTIGGWSSTGIALSSGI